MFGYIKPLQCELKVRELERFKACYCGLCHTLGKRYGFPARFILSYEFVFLSMLLTDENESIVINKKRCIASPLCKKKYCTSNVSLELCAGYTIILSWWKLQDTINDESLLRSIPHRFIKLFLIRSYKKARKDLPGFDNHVKLKLEELAQYEKHNLKFL